MLGSGARPSSKAAGRMGQRMAPVPAGAFAASPLNGALTEQNHRLRRLL